MFSSSFSPVYTSASACTSTSTLVDSCAWDRADAHAVFTFSRDDMRRTTLSLRGCGPRYIVHPDRGFSRVTISHPVSPNVDADAEHGTPIAVIEQRGFLPDRITFHGKQRTRLRSWLKFSTLTLFPVTFQENGRIYSWRTTQEGTLALYIPNTTSPIAWFNPSRPTEGEPARLTLRPEASAIQDAVVVSFLILEHKARTSTPPQADALAGQYVYYF
ncbi:hypothetical protein H0H81_005997 [Sphagnurus paluster]|uniref:DUF6593 domain-containing protein n=1 Tax=Sphagnurus paluster TaxID=117069 RepID=A0A9P7K3R6_9AGAR|nr:hypothetical protein H0H81_005997 [Sphagnurus paluster]